MAKIKLISTMLIFSTVGIFVALIDLPSSVIALARAAVGACFLGAAMLLMRKKPDWHAIRKNGAILFFSGAALGANWIFLFQAYDYATIPVVTLCYYMAPVFVILISPLVVKERLTAMKTVCSAVAAGGAVLISGALTGGETDLRGVALGLIAAALYCSVTLLNKFLTGLSSLDATLSQLAVAAAVMIPYVLLTEDVTALTFTPGVTALLVMLGVVQTGIAYLLYFSAVPCLPAQTAAVFSYIDPVMAIVLAALVLKQGMNLPQIAGMVLILGATLAQELLGGRQATPAGTSAQACCRKKP